MHSNKPDYGDGPLLSRRAILLGLTAATLASPRLRAAESPPPIADASSALDGFFDRLVNEQYELLPERATFFGLDRGANAAWRSRVTDRSNAGREANRALTLRQLAELKAYSRAELSQQDLVNIDVAIYVREAAAALQVFDFGATAAPLELFPYSVSQMTGAHMEMSGVLQVQAARTAEDADAWLARFEAYGKQIDDETARVRHEAAIGVVLPDFLLDQTIAHLGTLSDPAGPSADVKRITEETQAAGLGERYAAAAARVHQDVIAPAFRRQVEVLRDIRPASRHQPGLWRLKDGPGFYAAALRCSTTTRMTPAEVHAFGLEAAKATHSRMDKLLAAQGMTRGTVAERMTALARDPQQIYPNTDAGKAEFIAFAQTRLTLVEERLPRAFRNIPKLEIELRRSPPETEGGGPSASSSLPPPDGSRPGIVWFNLKDSAVAPKYTVGTVIYHEAAPGHMLEAAYSFRNRLPLIRKLTMMSGFGEGWALYAEQLADELGLYEDDPLGRLGYLQLQLFRANRCVVDTGLHAMRWSREQAVQYLTEQGGDTAAWINGEVDRFCVMVGQACSYKIGQAAFLSLRDKSRARLGRRFDLAAFHEIVLAHGHLPLEMLQRVGEVWMSRQVS